ncbi:MAG: adenylate kinase [Bacteroidetes bacterium HGW-Bacteroidetes-21]|jgi:adenylate kinase|nr:MAG: adenylate kinase [Bacteroidetes bacterium HGW-Bacteroidetes-21]
MLNLVLFGPPGAGKGTQSKRLIETYDLMHLSTGDILRYEIADETALGMEAKKRIDKGELVPDEIVIGMITKIVEKNKQVPGFIFDGFPRTVHQASVLDEILHSREMSITMMLSLEVEEEELITRLLNRGKKSNRPDDQDVSIIERRLKVYKESTQPVRDYYINMNKHVSIFGMRKEEEVFSSIREAIDNMLNKKDIHV